MIAEKVLLNEPQPTRQAYQKGRFETFVPLTLETKASYDYYAGFLPAALASPVYFQSLYAWNFALVIRYKIFDGHLCVVADDTITGNIYALPPLGVLDDGAFSSAVRSLLREFEHEGLPCEFHETPGFMLPQFSSLDGYKAEISYDRDWSDYVFSGKGFAEGLQKRSSREARRSFERRFRPRVHEIASYDGDAKEAALAVTKNFFCSERMCPDCFCGCELKVVSRMMEGWDELGMKGVIIESEGEAIAFGTVCFQKDTMLFLSKKVRWRTRGLNEYLNATLMDSFGGGCGYVNYSDDMGSEGLRAQKSRMGEYALAHRYVVKLSREPGR
ncbi:MAG: hypothetical protein FWG71_08560 [Synergistaceae bacterium]|nr:hypothetical protein [Synergistaceae bacterium]